MLIHEVVEGRSKATLCCGTFPALLPSGDLVTEHAGIVTCDMRLPRCPDCNAPAGYLGIHIEPPNFGVDEAVRVLKVDPCAHEFRMRITVQDSKIRLEKRTRERGHGRTGWNPAGDAEAGQPEEHEEDH